MRKIFTIVILIVFVIVSITSQKKFNETVKAEYAKFYTDELDGKLTGFFVSRGSVIFTLDKIDQYRFIPISIGLNSEDEFDKVAHVGDRVIKSSKSDTLKLLHNGRTYFYKFREMGK